MALYQHAASCLGSPGRRALLTGLIGSVAAACTAPAPATTGAQASLPNTWPGAEWERISPEQAGWDMSALAAAQAYAQTIGTATFAVVQHGRMVVSVTGMVDGGPRPVSPRQGSRHVRDACPMDQPADAGVHDNLLGTALPAISLPSTRGGVVALRALTAPRTVIYCYPRTSEPGRPAPTGWDLIPGARGCTPQACTFRDHHGELSALGADVFGLSTQATAYQAEMAERLHLPFPVLSDERFEFTNSLGLPTFEVDGMRLLKRLTMIVRSQRIEAVFCPVPQPEQSAEAVLAWLKANPLPLPQG